MSIQTPVVLVNNADTWAYTQRFWVNICILMRSPAGQEWVTQGPHLEKHWIGMFFTQDQESSNLEATVDFSWSYARLNWSLEPIEAFKINKQISVLKLGCQHLQSQDKCASCLSIFMGQVCACVSEKGWHQSQKTDWPDRATASAPPPHSHPPKMPTPWARSSRL